MEPKLVVEFSGEFRYRLLKSGEKKIEVRALDKAERKTVKEGDILQFLHIEKNDSFLVRVIKVKQFYSIKEIFDEGTQFLKDTFPGEEISSLEELYDRYKKVAPDYDKRIDMYGAVAWWVEPC